MKTLLLFLALASVCHAQPPILSENFASGALPSLWTSRFGYVTASPLGAGNVLAFHNRSTSNDLFTAAMDLSAPATYALTFDFLTSATDTHNLLFGLSVGGHVTYFAGSPAAATFLPLTTTFSSDGSGGWQSETIDLGLWLTNYTPLELGSITLAITSRLNGALSSAPVYLADVAITDPPSAIPEPSAYAAIIGLGTLLAVFFKQKNHE